MKIVFAILTLAVLFVLSLFCGSVHLPPADVLAALMGNGDGGAVELIVLQSRMPSAVTAIMAGAALSTCGLMLQTAFHNPLAGPSILGISSGANLGVALVMLISGGAMLGAGSYMAIIMAALVGSLAVTALLLAISATIRNRYSLLIAGMMVSYLISSIITLLTFRATEQGLQGYVIWGMGNFSMVTLPQLPWLVTMVTLALLACLPMIKPLNLMQLGEQYAENLGVSISRLRRMLLLTTGILCAVITAFCGPISFIGLAVPHIVRMITRTDNFRTLMPGVMICGAIIALVCNIISTIPSATVIPLAAITPLIGAPVVLYVIFRKQ